VSSIGDLLRAARERVGWSREALAYHSGLSCAAIAQIESGRRQDVRLASLAALAEALGVSVDYLVGGARAPASQLLEHRAFVYDSDNDYLATVVPYVRDGARRGEAVLAVTTKQQIRRLRTALGDDAALVDFHSSAGWYQTPTGALHKYRRYLERRLESGAPWVRIVGEPIWAGRSEAEIDKWVRYEAIINLSFLTSPATIVCPYDARLLTPAVIGAAHRTHPELADGPHVSPSRAYAGSEALLLSGP
jgi:transcriptional regulator with XRE-family HTH domain